MIMKRFLAIFVSVMGLNALFAATAQALCPICTIAVVAGVGFSRWLGVDDTVTGLWVGALIVSVTMWTISWFDGRKIRFWGRDVLTAVGYYVITLVPLYFAHFFVHSVFSLGLQVDKLLLGIVVGSLAFWTAALWYEWMKAHNKGHAYFPFQKVAMPIVLLLFLSGTFYLLTL